MHARARTHTHTHSVYTHAYVYIKFVRMCTPHTCMHTLFGRRAAEDFGNICTYIMSVCMCVCVRARTHTHTHTHTHTLCVHTLLGRRAAEDFGYAAHDLAATVAHLQGEAEGWQGGFDHGN